MDFKVTFREESKKITPVFREDVIYIAPSDYKGAYEVLPKFENQILPTKNKTLSADITVNAIEVSRVSNPTGGKTIYIGGIING